jgi:HAD superfamily hydrolase (TIGR01509 family)
MINLKYLKLMRKILFFIFIAFLCSSVTVCVEITGAIFDMDGTLIDSMKMWSYVGNTYLNDLGIKITTDLDKDMYSMGVKDAVKYLKTNYNLPQSDEKISFDIEQIIEHYYENVVCLKPGVKEFILDMKNDNIPILIATSSMKKLAVLVLSRFFSLEDFIGILSCHDFKTDKSKPDIYIEAVKVIQGLPENTLVFEDSICAAKTAYNAGFVVVGVYDDSNMKNQEELKLTSNFYLSCYPQYSTFKKILREKRKGIC